MNEQLEQVSDYINKAMASGVAEQAVRETLAKSGWPQALVDEGFLRYYSPALPQPVAPPPDPVPLRRKGRGLLYGAIALFVIIIIAVIAFASIHMQKTPAPKSSDASKKSSVSTISALQANAAKVGRENDASAIVAGIDAYINNNNGTLPQMTATDASQADVVDICGSACDPTTQSSIMLGTYKPAAVTFKSYASTLKVPDVNTVYIVPGAACDGTNLAASQSDRAIVVAYAVASGSAIEQKCLSN